jgi:four helix bundle protein
MAKDFTELAAWQLSHELRQLMLAITARENVRRDFKYCNQCKDAARSAASNIAEGFGRFSHKEFAFYC